MINAEDDNQSATKLSSTKPVGHTARAFAFPCGTGPCGPPLTRLPVAVGRSTRRPPVGQRSGPTGRDPKLAEHDNGTDFAESPADPYEDRSRDGSYWVTYQGSGILVRLTA